jgi:hypothetical protein
MPEILRLLDLEGRPGGVSCPTCGCVFLNAMKTSPLPKRTLPAAHELNDFDLRAFVQFRRIPIRLFHDAPVHLDSHALRVDFERAEQF